MNTNIKKQPQKVDIDVEKATLATLIKKLRVLCKAHGTSDQGYCSDY